MTSDPTQLSAAELLVLYRERKLSPVEATKAAFARIEKLNPAVNAYIHLDPDGALAAARASEERWMAGKPKGLVDGVPTGIKDNILVAGMPARFGSKLTSETPQTMDSPAVARMREHGAVILGKTTMPEYGWKAVSDSPLTGLTRNPWNTRMTPGGSSSGAVASAVLGMGNIHLGTDGGGSIRIPAGFTGVFGHKPTRARVPAYPAAPLGTLAHTGPLTRTVTDAAIVMSVISTPDPRDVYAWPTPQVFYRNTLEDGVRGLRIAYSPRLGFVPRVHPEIEAAVAKAAHTFESLGATVEQADPDIGGDPIAAWNTIWWSSMALTLAPYGERPKTLADPGLLAGATSGLSISATDYMRAQLKRAELHAAFVRFHETYDLLLTPTLPLPAFEVGHLVPPSGEWGTAWCDWAPFSYPFNLTQQPAASVPCGLTSAGLPIGLQIVGPIGADDRVLRAARAFEITASFPMLDAPRA